ncbi:MAG: ATP-dependent zinc metalloprotease FtsH, partial [Verrucomicrobia bacterium]|nr:ATP-dependent zinc metalloprotease FtsH [Verrucomicrobiota bacterium]
MRRQNSVVELSYPAFIEKVRDGEIVDGTISYGNDSFVQDIRGYLLTKTDKGKEPARVQFHLQHRVTEALSEELSQRGFTVKAGNSTLMQLMVGLLPVLLFFLLLWFFFWRQFRAAGKGTLSFGKSRARMLARDRNKVTFKDVGGIAEAKEEVREIVEFLRDPKKFQRLGGRIPKGVLMTGPPGTGKTLLAKAIAGEADVPFFSISGSDFVEMFVGVGASRVRDMFEQGRKHAPCLIFIDEIDAVGRSRFSGIGGGHDEREQTLNQLLAEMDGFDTSEGVIIIAATNRPDVLDPALRRPGRFDREIVVDMPDLHEREQILKLHARNVKLAIGVDLKRIARGTPGFSGADLANLVNEAALIAARGNKKAIGMDELEEARDKVRWGRERRSRSMDEREKKATAYHEAGHAIVQVLLDPGDYPLHKVTIIPRGQSLGSTMSY